LTAPPDSPEFNLAAPSPSSWKTGFFSLKSQKHQDRKSDSMNRMAGIDFPILTILTILFILSKPS
jgi:hypothetical protein